MKFPKNVLAIPLAASLMIPTAAFAQNSEDHSGSTAPVQAAAHGTFLLTDTPAAELRIGVETALTEHGFLAVEVMQKGADGAEDFDQAAAALFANSDDIAAAISSLYGQEGGAAFLEIWNSHIGYLVDYVTAANAGDQAGMDQALADLEEYKTEQAAFFESATDGRLPAAALEEGLTMHIDQLLKAFDAYKAGDFETAYMQEREAIHHMSMFGETLSIAVADQFPTVVQNTNPDTPAADLRSHLNHLFTEHAGLAVMAMQDGIDGAESFEQSAGALLANADDLSAAVASVYGEEAGEAFSDIWTSHIGYFVDYVTATAENSKSGRDKAKADLDEYIVEQAAFLEAATDGRIPAEALEAGLTEHVGQLLSAFDSYVTGDYDTAYDALRESYAHMTMPAAGLSAAIVDQFPSEFLGDTPFTDVSGRYQDAVAYLYFKTITNGLTDTRYGVDQPLSRIDAAIMIAKSTEMIDSDSTMKSPFTDVPARGEAAVAALEEADIINGKTATMFDSFATITRGEAALILANAYDVPATSQKAGFTDVSSRYQDAVNRLAAAGIVSGKSASKFGTMDQVTRGELALMIYQLEMME